MIAVIVLFIKSSSTNRRLDRHAESLRLLLKGKKGKHTITEEVDHEGVAEKFKQLANNDSVIVGEEVAEKTSEPFAWEDFFTRKFFAILGVISLLLALGFFLAWSFSSGIIGPTGRIAIGVLLSVLSLGGGEFLREKYPKFFALLSSLGIAGLIITTFYARHAYGFITPLQSFGLYMVEVGAGIFLSLRYQSRVLANFSILGGLLAPMLTGALPDQFGLMAYLLVLTVAGFVVSYKQKWPEISVVLLVGVFWLENVIFDASRPISQYCEDGSLCETKLGWINQNGILFLVFVYLVHLLLASGGVFRMIKENVQQKFSATMSGQSATEMILFVTSILLANLMAYNVFDVLNWEHFGFFVLAQGFGYYFLSEYLKQQGLELFQKISIAATMISVIFATAWEIPDQQEFIKSAAFLAEGILFAFAGSYLKDKVFMIFARVGLALGGLMILDQISSDTIPALVLIVAYFGGLILTLKDFDETWEKVLGILGYLAGAFVLFIWNWEWVEEVATKDTKFLLLIVPALFAVATAYGKIIPSMKASRILGMIFASITTFMAWVSLVLVYRMTDLSGFITTLLTIAMLLGVLAAFFLEEEKKSLSYKSKNFAVYWALILATATVLLWSFSVLDEPLLTLALIGWGGLLMGLGLKNDWTRFRYFGIGMFLFIIAKLYIVDVWGWDTPVRFGAFLMLGVALLSLSFLSQKFFSKK